MAPAHFGGRRSMRSSTGSAAAPAAPFTPTDITTLKFWLDAEGLSAGALTTWTDKSPNAWSPTQATEANKPTVVAAAYNGLPCVRFDATDVLVKGGLAAGEYIAAYGEALYIWMVLKIATAGGADYQQPFGFRTKPGDIDKVLGIGFAQNDATYNNLYFGNTEGNNTQVSWGAHRAASTAPTGSLQCYKLVKSTGSPTLAASWSSELDFVSKAVTATSGDNGMGFTSNTINIGGASGTGEAVFDLCELVIAGEDSPDMEAYLTDKWGL